MTTMISKPAKKETGEAPAGLPDEVPVRDLRTSLLKIEQLIRQRETRLYIEHGIRFKLLSDPLWLDLSNLVNAVRRADTRLHDMAKNPTSTSQYE